MGLSVRALPLLLTLTLAACGGGGSPTGPAPLPVSSVPPASAPPATAAPAPAVSPLPDAPPASVVLRSASFRGANGHSASGSVAIVRVGNQHRLEFGADFRIDSGRNDVYLSRSSERRDGVNLGDLRSTSGAQSYDLGAEDGSRHAFVLLWCRPFAVPIGVAEWR